jgi:uncharacterized protein
MKTSTSYGIERGNENQMTSVAETPEAATATSPIAGIHVIDADTHFTEPADLWTSRAPAKYKERVPRVVERAGLIDVGTGDELGDHALTWVVDDGVVLGQAGAGTQINKDNVKVLGTRFFHWPLTEAAPSATYLEPRLDLMDEVGIWGQIVYPNTVGFGGQNFGKIEDVELRNLCATIYNDAMVEFYEQSHGRLNGMAVLPWWDVKRSVAEVERVHQLGLKGVNISADPQLNFGLPDLSDDHWNPLWEVCQDLNVPVNFHVGASQTQQSWFGNTPWPSLRGNIKLALGSAVLYLGNARVIGNLIYSGILERYPTLKFVSVESGVGWIPFLLEALDYQAEEAGDGAFDHLSMKPSEYFHRQMYACFWFENDQVMTNIEKLGYDKCMFETDFPHPTCLYPNPLGPISETLAGVDYDIRKKLLSDNAATVYNIDVPAN